MNGYVCARRRFRALQIGNGIREERPANGSPIKIAEAEERGVAVSGCAGEGGALGDCEGDD